jgi:hypothetical protein
MERSHMLSMGKSIISMVMFNSFLYVYQSVHGFVPANIKDYKGFSCTCSLKKIWYDLNEIISQCSKVGILHQG